MIAYPDTSFLFALYRFQVNSPQAIAHAHAMPEAVHVTSLLLYEFRQAIRFQGFLHSKNAHTGFDLAAGQLALNKLQANIVSGGIILAAANWDDVIRHAEAVSLRQTSNDGYRAFDILHVATALHLGAREFLTFDAKQKKLAKSEGLKVPL